MNRKGRIDLIVKAVKCTVEFCICPADRSVGIMGESADELTLLNPDTEEPMIGLEAIMTDEDWEKLTADVNEKFDFDAATWEGPSED